MSGDPREPIIYLGLDVAERFIQNERLTFQGFAGLGRHGGALILLEKESPDHPGRKMVVKYSYGALAIDKHSNADDDLRNEYNCLKRLRGCEHIVQLIPLADCSINIPGVSNGGGQVPQGLSSSITSSGSGIGRILTRGSNAPSSASSGIGRVLTAGSNRAASGSGGTGRVSAAGQDPGQDPDQPDPQAVPTAENTGGRQCPTFAVEFLEWGTLHTFRERLIAGGVQRLPSRFLWRIRLCMIRQCAAMAFPPDHPEDAENIRIEREVLKDRDPVPLTQNSAHHENFVFGEPLDFLGNEHAPNLPVLKLIDFGRGLVVPPMACLRQVPEKPLETGSRVNIYHAARAFILMCNLNVSEDDFKDEEEYSYRWRARDGRNYRVRTICPKFFSNNGYIDQELRTLIVRCMVERLENVPSLREMVIEVVRHVEEKGPDHPRLKTAMASLARDSETNETIRQIIQEYIYDAATG
ncbi:hypothetical protein F5Y10DRAFT_122297 [Nemania abortiva]|nr:hypothetical protein F5Y10DRAFT_122297 [Nemania abortiva]